MTDLRPLIGPLIGGALLGALLGCAPARAWAQPPLDPALGGEPHASRVEYAEGVEPGSPVVSRPEEVAPENEVEPDEIEELDVDELEPEELDAIEDGGVVETQTRRIDGVLDGRAQRVERLGAEELARRGVTNLAEALEGSSAGGQVSPTGSTRGMVLDGLPASQVTVLRDGLPVAAPTGSPQGPIVDLNSIAISPRAIERIDIYRGVGPVGSGGAGGVVIDIVSRAAPRAPRAWGAAQWSGGAAERLDESGAALLEQRYDLGAEVPLGERWVLGGAGQYGQRGALDVNQDGVADRAALDQRAGELTLTHRRRDHDLWRVQALGADTTTQVLGGGAAAFDDVVRRQMGRGRIKGRRWIGQDLRLDLSGDLGRERHRFDKRVRASAIARPKSETTLDTALMSASATWFLRSHDLAAEVDGRGWRIEREGETGVLPEVMDARAGVGVADTWYVSERVEWFNRVYGRGATDVGAGLDAQSAASVRVTDRVVVRGMGARTQRAPSPEQLYLFFDHAEVGYTITGNPELEPEQLVTAQLGGIWTSEDQTFGVEVMGFHHWIDDVVVTVPDAAQPALFTYQNLGRARTAGAQAMVQARALPAGLEVLGNYTWMPVAGELTTGERLPDRAAHAGRAEVRKRWAGGRVQTWVDVTARSRREVPLGTPAAPGFTLLGAGAMVRAGERGRVMFDVNNILDQTNATWGPMPGLNGMLSVQWSAGGEPER